MENAVKYNRDGGKVVVRGRVPRETPGAVLVEVSDTGCGIPREDLPYIFDRFYRSRKASRKGRWI